MDTYIIWVKGNPILSAAIQFGILGTLGEIISFSLRAKKFSLPCCLPRLLLKVAAWALLGVIIKYGFAGMKGFVAALADHGMLPAGAAAGFGRALTISIVTNLLFGPQMMFFHRLEDNLIDWKWDTSGLTTAWWTLIWFWIPAHTVTFMLPAACQIGLAALWSIVLGLILGFVKKR